MAVPVFHPGHDELHGITVVVFTSGPKTYVGRWDAEQGDRVHMLDVAVHEEGKEERDRDRFLRDTKQYGVAVTDAEVLIPKAEVERVTKLGELELPAS